MILLIQCTSVPVLPVSVCSVSLGSSPVFVVQGPSCLSSPISYNPWLLHSSTPHLIHAELPLKTAHCFISLEHSSLSSAWLTSTHPQLRCHLLQKVFLPSKPTFSINKHSAPPSSHRIFLKNVREKKE